ncbi:LysR substrate-binding domain-containing protein [Gammaproteobacteria bacterium]|nr:LysR substrate-binding domain-containing protein [Gammaproteobacteria bacterium]
MKPIRHLRALQAFDAAATTSNLSKAAKVLGVTHGAVSRQIKQLEQYLGLLLFNRKPNGVEKTSAGNQLHVATRQAFSVLEVGLQNVKPVRDHRSVTISLSISLAIKWLVPRLPEFRKKFPGIAVYLDTNDDVVDLDNSEVDIALRFGEPDWGGLHYEILNEEELILVASSTLVAGKMLPMTPESIVRLPLLQDEFTPAWDKWAGLVGLDSSQVVSSKISFMNSAVLIAAVIDSQGVAPLRRILLVDDLKADRLRRLDDTVISLDSSLYFVCRNGDQDREPIRSLKNWLFSIPLNELN